MTNFKFISILKILQYTLLLHETVSNNNTSGIRENNKTIPIRRYKIYKPSKNLCNDKVKIGYVCIYKSVRWASKPTIKRTNSRQVKQIDLLQAVKCILINEIVLHKTRRKVIYIEM